MSVYKSVSECFSTISFLVFLLWKSTVLQWGRVLQAIVIGKVVDFRNYTLVGFRVGDWVLRAIVILADSAFQFTRFMRFKPIKIFPPSTLWNASAFSRTEFPQFKPNQADRIWHKTASPIIPHLVLYQHCRHTIPYQTIPYCTKPYQTIPNYNSKKIPKYTIPYKIKP